MNTEPSPIYEPCSQCGAPLDDRQRFCVECGASRRHPGDPVTRHFTTVTRQANPEPAAVVPPPRRGADTRLTALVLALLPVAAALGVLVGKHNSGSDKDLIAALKAAPATAGATTTAGNTGGGTVTSDFTLGSGYVVRLQTLPSSTTAAAVAKAKSAARAKGAKQVGVIDPQDFKLKPSSGKDFVLYSGQFKTKAAAHQALKKLSKRFPKAVVVTVGSPIGGHDKAAKIAAEDAVIRKHPTAKQKADGAKIVQQIQAKRGKSYVEQQQKLPDTIVVP
jgi:hypothetical protein